MFCGFLLFSGEDLLMEKKPLKILIVEDDRSFKAYALAALHGHDNVTAGTAEEAMAKFQWENPDITFLDIKLPDGNGLDLLEQMKKINPNAYIVMVTGSQSPEDVEASKKHKVNGYILKPFNVKKVQEFVDRFHASKK